MNIFVITLKNDKKRYNYVLNIKKNRLPNLQILDAIDGTKINKTFLDFLIKNNAVPKKILSTYSKGTIGCYLSHIKMWTHIRKYKLNHTIILEDDFSIKHNFEHNIQSVLKELPSDYDICYLFYHPFSYKYYNNFKKFDIDGKNFIRHQVPTWGLVGYIVSLQGAANLIKLCNTAT